MLKKVINFIYTFAILVVVLIAGATVLTITKAPGGIRLFVVQSGSMEPIFKIGSMVLIAPKKEYQVGDAITFLVDPAKTNLKLANATITHRITKIGNDQGRINYQTKGDANNAADKDMVSHNAVLGKVIFFIPCRSGC